MNYKFHILFFILVFIIVFLITYIMDLIKIKTKKKNKIGELNYVISKFSLDKNKINYKWTCFVISILNGIIIASTTTVVAMVKIHLSLQLLIGFVMLFSLIYSIYEIYGRYLKNRENRIKEKSKKGKKK